MRRIIAITLSVLSITTALAGDGNRLMRTAPDGGRIYSKHEIVGYCSLDDGTSFPCASSSMIGVFKTKYAGYWFQSANEEFLYSKNHGEVRMFSEFKIHRCSGKLTSKKSELQIESGEFICLLTNEDQQRVSKICKPLAKCSIEGYLNPAPTCGGECVEMLYVTAIGR